MNENILNNNNNNQQQQKEDKINITNNEVNGKFYEEIIQQSFQLIKEFIETGLNSQLILRMNEMQYIEYLQEYWSKNMEVPYFILKNTHTQLIWWENQLIPKAHLQLITELVASTKENKQDSYNEMKSFYLFCDSRENAINKLRNDWEKKFLKENLNKNNKNRNFNCNQPKRLSTIMSERESHFMSKSEVIFDQNQIQWPSESSNINTENNNIVNPLQTIINNQKQNNELKLQQLQNADFR
ncbi:hypothetical protein PPERSA_02764 [Pseudocohnilembus persalinus]|uniref:Uncharacterized protein n=1 Tax=Pseudocohnilembus persalinus TaxID=266149 RepID=A0A0V0Q8M9_PSEPJ|nr:hypothetical protein PPERSA_02764 [Pseudocohnilembus persalinus]|eukprot:KRW98616.1 hypothetical protein PPERSA_02764 [Pseudocohnilembus persalinus]